MTVTSTADWVSVSPLPLSSNDLSEWAVRPDCGAVVTFCGTARSSSTTGHDILSLEYETSIELAESRIIEVVASARTRWPEIGNVAVHHRVGVVPLSEPAVVVVVSSPHRHEAFAAAQFCIDTVKRCVPMWKREVWEDGSAWSEEAQPLLRVDDV
ncbi:MAG TPA: molybdenum cofactor biosynthesis protein MoaE [Acidimicrobiales bacterium]|nr:molybdenum cofactor biosynthesis protein MoaE [Acidimicrobiales bacterium]